MNDPCDPEYVRAAASHVAACEQVVAGYHAKGIEPPYPRVYVCAYCGAPTSMAPVTIDRFGRCYSWPSVCSADACCDAAVRAQMQFDT